MVNVRYPVNQQIELSRAAEELTTYAAQRLVGFERQIPGNAFHHPEARNEWIRDILRGMTEVNGWDSDPLIQAFDRGLDDAHGCFAVEMLDQPGQKHVIQSLRQYASALEQLGGDRRGQLVRVQNLLEDISAYLPWDPGAIGIYPARDQVESQLRHLTAQRPICFTRVLLGGEMGPGDEDFVSGSVMDADGVRGTALFDRLNLVYPKVEEWPAICTVYHGGGPAVLAATMPADNLDLQIMREEGVRFLDRPGICLAGHSELRVPVQEQSLEMDDGPAPLEFQML